jgi:quercetin dioxygenase-like cupin family protein
MTYKQPLTPEAYHESDAPTYAEPTDGAFKRHEAMAQVEYNPSHFNPSAEPAQQGHGRTLGTWIFNEESGKAEGILKSNIELVMDTCLAPNASIGYHEHHHTEEIYYLLEGQLKVTLQRANTETEVFNLNPGDAHRIGPNQGHFIQAGASGARFMVIAAKIDRL